MGEVDNKHKMNLQILLLLGLLSAAPAPTTKRFYKYLTRVYHIIEKNRDWYEDLLENKVSDHQFTKIFNFCSSDANFMTPAELRSCFGLSRERISSSHNDQVDDFLESFWHLIDTDDDNRLNMKEWKHTLFAFTYTNALVAMRGFDINKNNYLDENERQ